LNIQKNKKIESDRIIVTLRDDGIVHVHIKEKVVIDLDCQKEMQETYWKVAEKKRPFIFTAGEFISLTKDARKNAKTIEDEVPVSCTALIVKNLAQKILAEFYYKFDKPKNPLKVFSEFDKGIEWLKTISKQ
jgi:hypothetical protein